MRNQTKTFETRLNNQKGTTSIKLIAFIAIVGTIVLIAIALAFGGVFEKKNTGALEQDVSAEALAAKQTVSDAAALANMDDAFETSGYMPLPIDMPDGIIDALSDDGPSGELYNAYIFELSDLESAGYIDVDDALVDRLIEAFVLGMSDDAFDWMIDKMPLPSGTSVTKSELVTGYQSTLTSDSIWAMELPDGTFDLYIEFRDIIESY